MNEVGLKNGELMPLAELCVPATDRGFLLGDAVYETMRTYDGKLFALLAHLARLERSLAAVGVKDAPGANVLGGWLRAAVDAAFDGGRREGDEAVVRVTVTRGPGPHGFSARGAGPAQVYGLVRSLPGAPEAIYTEGLRVITAKTRRVASAAQDPMIKAASALNLILARMEADAVGADDALLCNAQGEYLEASGANLVVIRGNTVRTPHGTEGVLDGVTLQKAVELLAGEGYEIHWGPIEPEMLFGADEVWLTQTTRELVPVVQIDGRPVGAGVPGPAAKRIRERFLKEVRGRWQD